MRSATWYAPLGLAPGGAAHPDLHHRNFVLADGGFDGRGQHAGRGGQVDVAVVGGGQLDATVNEQLFVTLEVVHGAVHPVLVPGGNGVNLARLDVG